MLVPWLAAVVVRNLAVTYNEVMKRPVREGTVSNASRSRRVALLKRVALSDRARATQEAAAITCSWAFFGA